VVTHGPSSLADHQPGEERDEHADSHCDHPLGSPRRLFVVHGEPGPAAALADRVTRELGWNVSVPAYQDRVTLD
jgi:predicted metal-dependent RNase